MDASFFQHVIANRSIMKHAFWKSQCAVRRRVSSSRAGKRNSNSGSSSTNRYACIVVNSYLYTKNNLFQDMLTDIYYISVHAAPQYFLRFTMGVGWNLLQDYFLGLPEHTWEKRNFFNNAVFDLFAFFKNVNDFLEITHEMVHVYNPRPFAGCRTCKVHPKLPAAPNGQLPLMTGVFISC